MSLKIIKILLCSIIISLSSSVFAQSNTFLLKGKIEFEKSGDIFIYLVTEKIFKTPFTGVQDTLIKISKDELQKKNVSFKFEDVKSGTYCIRCFQDVNGNGKLDKCLFGPKEPWAMSWQGEKPAKWPKFKHVAFEVNSNITNIKIELR